MPKSKTIEVDEILTPGESAGEANSPHNKTHSGSGSGSGDIPFGTDASFDPASMIKDFQKSLPWKARLTLKLTSWFILLRGKRWGKLVIIPAVILAALLAIPLGLIAAVWLILRSFLRSFR